MDVHAVDYKSKILISPHQSAAVACKMVMERGVRFNSTYITTITHGDEVDRWGEITGSGEKAAFSRLHDEDFFLSALYV